MRSVWQCLSLLHRGILVHCGLLSLFVSAAAAAAADVPSEAAAERLLALRKEAQAHEHGEGVPRDYARAVKLYCDGARMGDSEAQFSLGWMYANGRGVDRNDALAAYFFSLAAKQGHLQSQKMQRFVGDPTSDVPDCMRLLPPFDEGTDDMLPRNEAQKMIVGLVHQLAPEYGVSPRLALAVIRTESNFNAGALSSKNAQGLMQLIPDTSARFNVKNPFNPEQNLRGGLAYLRWLLAYFEGDVSLVAAAYNAGEGAVNRYRGVPPYAETRGYVQRIISLFKRDDHPYDARITTPSPELPRIRLSKGA
ncbi:MAG TPA: transglycosylase SLT domain-containing protein [Accumulibacter sp.]|uniref:Membrane-bound lytic murein transglycosylase C n=1 Tax=Candidatus Accumulibacter cognatus TaxID=2954383 RepID=A0A080MK35_9PROT|nr:MULTISPECIES: transglycosylase SLT domain-containing protein [Candidatus Accumulibacter]MCQ1549584.1 transglycosylase SLT domain-containing protein [Candidatus Accumulibacter phosphatis]KFB77629.1 MAG: Membrane-bound lytic murein transglycosylase C precursor [Candidatus Accumulibacter cognatus]MBL8399726.1 transglycosylase SLT domain-containing protein [Accumulibacter sp.]MBN8517323.1 transglycosylase SLT domain-containing protein [Accumulibacter sp.]MBO3710867.1 transglycosylase SLT domain